MRDLTISSNFQKRVRQGVSFILVGATLATIGSSISQVNQNRDNHRYHELHQEETNTQLIKVSQGINLYLNDHVFIPKDALGNEVFSFVCNGTTYLPIRAITSALGAEVGYENNTVIITRKENAKVNPGVEWRKDQTISFTEMKALTGIAIIVDGKPFVPKDANGNIVPIYVVNGTTYVPLRALCLEFNIPVVWDGLNNRIYLGKHINLTDPNTWSSEEDKIMQNDYNLTNISFEQIKTDIQVLRQQFVKFEKFANTLVNTYPVVSGTYHDELEQFHSEVAADYLKLLQGCNHFNDEYIIHETDFLATIMDYKDEISPAISNLDRLGKEIAIQELEELNVLCSDERIEQLYNRLNDIVRRYQESLGKSKTFVY